MRARLLWSWLCLLLAIVLVGCQRNSDELAKLESKQGGVERDFAAGLGKWSVAPIPTSFKVGDGVRTSAGARAQLRLSDASNLELQEKTLLRFLATPPGGKSHGLDVQSGEVELTAGEAGLKIETGSGPAVLEPGARLRVSKTERGTRFAVEIGAAYLTDAKQNLKAGDAIEIGIGRAILERTAAVTSAAPSVAGAATGSAISADADAATDAATDAGAGTLGDDAGPREPDVRTRGPELVDLFASAGDSLIIHDPKPPTAIAFTGSRCPGLVVLELGKKRAETIGTGKVSGNFPAGAQRYRLRCEPDKVPFAEGTISVLRDSGSRRLASGAPVNRIDADGRRYTILYQNLLPKVSVQWPNPPSAGPFTLSLRSQGKAAKQFSAASPSYTLPGGALSEGSHELWFEGGGQRSRATTVSVQFDNAAPTASISTPAERGFAPGATVAVSGMALPGWTVSVAGRELARDAQERFSGEVQAPSDVRALSIRFSHPQRGVHYYLRRSSQ